MPSILLSGIRDIVFNSSVTFSDTRYLEKTITGIFTSL